MKKGDKPASPDAYVQTLDGWQRKCVTSLRKAVTAEKQLEEAVKYGHLVYLCDGPVLLIRAEEQRVLFGFWRGKRLTEIEPRLKPSGKYELATAELHDGDTVKPATLKRLVKAAVVLNQELGDPRDDAKRATKKKAKRRRSR